MCLRTTVSSHLYSITFHTRFINKQQSLIKADKVIILIYTDSQVRILLKAIVVLTSPQVYLRKSSSKREQIKVRDGQNPSEESARNRGHASSFVPGLPTSEGL